MPVTALSNAAPFWHVRESEGNRGEVLLRQKADSWSLAVPLAAGRPLETKVEGRHVGVDAGNNSGFRMNRVLGAVRTRNLGAARSRLTFPTTLPPHPPLITASWQAEGSSVSRPQTEAPPRENHSADSPCPPSEPFPGLFSRDQSSHMWGGGGDRVSPLPPPPPPLRSNPPPLSRPPCRSPGGGKAELPAGRGSLTHPTPPEVPAPPPPPGLPGGPLLHSGPPRGSGPQLPPVPRLPPGRPHAAGGQLHPPQVPLCAVPPGRRDNASWQKQNPHDSHCMDMDRGACVGADIPGSTLIGRDNRIGHHAVVGARCQDLKYVEGTQAWLRVGDGNDIREHCSIHRSSKPDDVTVIGSRNLLMGACHVAHDCKVGEGNILANATLLGGHVVMEDWVHTGGGVAVHQFCHLGSHSFLAGGAMVVLDVPAFSMVAGDRAELRGINDVGMKRCGFSEMEVAAVRKAYQKLFMGSGPQESIETKIAKWRRMMTWQNMDPFWVF